jgi:hypothetical protein
MRRRSQVTLRALCLLLLALAALACQEEPAAPAGEDPTASLPVWARCENWRRPNHSCDQTALLADYEECVRTDGDESQRRLHSVGRLARSRAVERTIIVCLERRHWMMKAAGLRNLPGRPQPAAPPS